MALPQQTQMDHRESTEWKDSHEIEIKLTFSGCETFHRVMWCWGKRNSTTRLMNGAENSTSAIGIFTVEFLTPFMLRMMKKKHQIDRKDWTVHVPSAPKKFPMINIPTRWGKDGGSTNRRQEKPWIEKTHLQNYLFELVFSTQQQWKSTE